MASTDQQAEAGGTYEAVFMALAHPARRRILISLNFAGGAMSAGQIARLFGHAWPTTTRHLQVLMAAGIVTQDRQGRTRLYRLNPARLALARDWLGWFGRDPVTGEDVQHKPGDEDHAAVQAQHRGQGSR
ncbi:ArsR/SmtB family transcription factor [Phenylobacterium sp.]|uniref:ArsR/SmtB family transcription factor n=1 Tax=Phenylobacterium sp. TaxID=1871053 RepID=UPI003569FCD4